MAKAADKKHLISIEDLFRGSFEVYKKSWRTLLVISLITVILWRIWQVFLFPGLLVATGLGSLVVGFATGNIASAVSLGALGIAIIILSLFIVFEIGFLGSAALILAIDGRHKGKKLTLSDIYEEIWKVLLPVTIVGLLTFLFEGLGFILLVLPGLFLLIFLEFANYVAVVEKKGGLSALQKSISLVKRHFWGVFTRYVAISIISFLFNYIFSGYFLLLLASQTVIMPFTVAYSYLLYRDVSAKS